MVGVCHFGQHVQRSTLLNKHYVDLQTSTQCLNQCWSNEFTIVHRTTECPVYAAVQGHAKSADHAVTRVWKVESALFQPIAKRCGPTKKPR